MERKEKQRTRKLLLQSSLSEIRTLRREMIYINYYIKYVIFIFISIFKPLLYKIYVYIKSLSKISKYYIFTQILSIAGFLFSYF